MSGLKLHILDTGYCIAHEHHLIRGGRHTKVDCHALAVLIEHPQRGLILFDTGYAPRMKDVTGPFSFRIYRWLTPLRLDPDLAVVHQLGRFGLSAQDIQHVFVSHFHADHIAGLRDFPSSRLISSRSGYEDIKNRRGFSALVRAFIPSLMPEDFSKRACLIDQFSGPPLDELGPTHDLFDDGSLLAVQLPGHARGQLGLMVQSEEGPTLLAADGCWLSRSYRENRPPHPITHAFIDDTAAMHETLHKLHAFHLSHPTVRIVPTHCPEALELHA